MPGPISTSTVMEWAEIAHSTLQKAQELCSNAEIQINSTEFQLTTHLPDILDESSTLYEAVKHQHELIIKVIDNISQYSKRSLIEIPQMQINTLLNPALSNLDAILLQLHSTTIPSFLILENLDNNDNVIDNDDNTPERPLDDFISTDSITLLRTNVEIYKNNWSKIRQVLDTKLHDSISEPCHILVKRYNKANKVYDEIKPLQLDVKNAILGKSPLESNSVISTLLKENSSLGHELVKLLKMLTNHYDQCNKGLELIKNGSSIDLEILRNDTLELPEVLKDLNTVCDMIVSNGNRAQRYLDTHSSKIEGLIITLKEQLDLYRAFKTKNLPQFILLVDQFDELLNTSSLPNDPDSNQTPIETYAKTLNELTYHYTQFLNIIKTKYLEELHYEQFVYPKRFLNSLTKFLNEDLYKLQAHEKERRKQWLAKYGDFIPKQFNIPGERNQPTVVQVITEGLEEVQRDQLEVEADEKKLVDFINRFSRSGRRQL